MIESYLLRPTLASLGLANRYVDERQLSIHYHSSNIAFVAMLIACIVIAAKLSAEGDHNWEILNFIIVLVLPTKALFNVVLAKSFREGAIKIIITAGPLITLFSAMDSMEHGLSFGNLMNLVPGLAIVGFGIFAKYFPRLVGVMVFLGTAALEFFIFSKGFNWVQIGTDLIIGIPLIIAGMCLFSREKIETGIETGKSD